MTHQVHRCPSFLVGIRGECPVCYVQNDSHCDSYVETVVRTAAAHPTLLQLIGCACMGLS